MTYRSPVEAAAGVDDDTPTKRCYFSYLYETSDPVSEELICLVARAQVYSSSGDLDSVRRTAGGQTATNDESITGEEGVAFLFTKLLFSDNN